MPPLLAPSIRRCCCQTYRAAVVRATTQSRWTSSATSPSSSANDLPESRLNPRPDDYAAPTFADRAELSLHAGRGGNGCISFLREAFLPDGPPNGGDGGAGGNVYIQAAHGETSLHKLARRRFMRAGRGKHGQGSAKSGPRGDDIIITVPVGTIVRELEREDPAAEEAMNIKAWRALQKQRRKEQLLLEEEKKRQGLTEPEPDLDRKGNPKINPAEDEADEAEDSDPQRQKWLLYPGMAKSEIKRMSFPRLPTRTRLLQQPPASIYLDLSEPTPRPILLATGGVGGLGNPHFTSREHPKPMFATKGDDAVSMKISLELKLLADVGLVGLPNAGKSTLLRAITNSRTRVGSWAFTTLQPNIGTVVLDKYSGRPEVATGDHSRSRFMIADIPGLIEGAHLDRGLGIAFLRHVERAGVLAFVVDLSAGDAVAALSSLWNEVGLYAQMRDEEELDREVDARVDWDTASHHGPINAEFAHLQKPVQPLHIAGKPWFVVATKADLPETQENYRRLQAYLDRVSNGDEPHPSGVDGAWTARCNAIPVSAIHGQGVDRIVHWTAGLLNE